MRAKNKSLMRRRLAEAGAEHVAAAEIRADGKAPGGLCYPVVLKPAEGVASEDVMLVISPEELAERSAQILCRRPGETLLAEEYLSGELHTLETLSDGKRTWVLGGFRTTLSPLPFFIEERLTWAAPAPEAAREHVLAAVPPAGPRPTGQRDVLLSVRSLREAGDRVAVSHTNRDYLCLHLRRAARPGPAAAGRTGRGSGKAAAGRRRSARRP